MLSIVRKINASPTACIIFRLCPFLQISRNMFVPLGCAFKSRAFVVKVTFTETAELLLNDKLCNASTVKHVKMTRRSRRNTRFSSNVTYWGYIRWYLAIVFTLLNIMWINVQLIATSMNISAFWVTSDHKQPHNNPNYIFCLHYLDWETPSGLAVLWSFTTI